MTARLCSAWLRWCRNFALRFPALFAEEWYETDISKLFSAKFGRRNSCYTHQFLRAGGGANWNYQTPANLELHLQRFWNFWPACCNYNRVVGRMFGPAAGAIAVHNVHIVIPLLSKCGGGLFSQLSDPFNRVDVLRYFSEDSCRVTRACTDFENLFATFEKQCFDHKRDNIGLRNSLTARDRQRRILVGKFTQIGGQKFFTPDSTFIARNTDSERTPRAAM